MNSMKLQIGPVADAVERALAEAVQQDVVQRIWNKDASLWKTDAKAQENIRTSLGWLTVAEEMLGVADQLIEFTDFIRERGFRHVMVCGMGGSSLCPEVLGRSFGHLDGFPELIVLDSTDPDVVADLAQRLDIDRCLFSIASKSGSTIEPNVFYKFWYEFLRKRKPNPGQNFIAITDPGSPLIQTASQAQFQRVFLNQSDIGGRFSALSYFGMVPAALAGIDVNQFLTRAQTASEICSAITAEINPGLQLGSIMSECARLGRDKLTLVIDDRIASLGLWIEQLVAESTGKEGTGILPVAGEPLGDPAVYGDDRLFISIAMGEIDTGVSQKLETLSAAGHPVVYRTLRDTYDLASEFFVWEFATACAGWRLAINPFDQPDVQLAKQATNELLKIFENEKRLPQLQIVAKEPLFTVFADESSPLNTAASSGNTVLREYFASTKSGDYIAVLSYIEETPETETLLRHLQKLLRDRTHCATTTGYGPRYLHSTGQLHKGGRDNGLFLQILASDENDFPIPGEDYSFSILKRAQATGDFQALSRRGRRILGVDIGNNGVDAIKRLLEVLS